MVAETDQALKVRVLSPDRLVLEGEADYVVLRSTEGDLAIHPGHEPLVTPLDITAVRYRAPGGSERRLAVHHGYLRVMENDVLILAQIAERGDQIDAVRARAARERAERRLREARPETDTRRTERSLRKALIRLLVIGRE